MRFKIRVFYFMNPRPICNVKVSYTAPEGLDIRSLSAEPYDSRKSADTSIMLENHAINHATGCCLRGLLCLRYFFRI